jgi:hypothetical protein
MNMSLEDMMAKLKESFSEEEIAALMATKEVEKPNTEELSAERAAKARILEEKKKQIARNIELEGELEALKTKDMTETELLNSKYAKQQEAFEALMTEKSASDKQLAETVMSYNLEKIGNSINFMDTIPQDLRDMAIKSSFSEVDINDAEALTAAKTGFSEKYATIMASENVSSGAETSNGKKESAVASKDPSKITVEQRAEQLSRL